MADDEKTEINIDGLNKLAKAFKKVPVVHVGILGDGNTRNAKPGEKAQLSNSQIGAMHEFGTSTSPQRSFLRVPLIENLNKRLENDGVFNKQEVARAIAQGTLRPVMLKVGIVAEDIVLGAFDSGGYGSWAPLKPATLAQKKNHQILVETQQLRNSISNEVVESTGESD